MDFDEWERFYREILLDFGFEREEDERSASVLSELLEGSKLASPDDLERLIRGRIVAVVGGARHLESELDNKVTSDVLIAADGTTSTLLGRAITPDIIVTDLDGPVEDQIAANEKGAIAAIHAHGDNIPQIQAHVPRFPGKVMGTVQCRPFGHLNNFGGFTDGDRGVFLAAHFGAQRIRLVGFDFDEVGFKDNCNRDVKLRKLKWAQTLISYLDIPIE